MYINKNNSNTNNKFSCFSFASFLFHPSLALEHNLTRNNREKLFAVNYAKQRTNRSRCQSTSNKSYVFNFLFISTFSHWTEEYTSEGTRWGKENIEMDSKKRKTHRERERERESSKKSGTEHYIVNVFLLHLAGIIRLNKLILFTVVIYILYLHQNVASLQKKKKYGEEGCIFYRDLQWLQKYLNKK